MPVKSIDQQAIGALHRLRSGYLQTRTARINAVRGHLREFGITIPVGAQGVLPHARQALEDGAVPEYLQDALAEVLDEIESLNAKAKGLERTLERLAHQMPETELLMTVPGIGVLTATVLVAFVGDVRRFRSGRQFSAYLGLTPREFSSGSTRRLGRITKRGNSHVRMMLIHGARSALRAGKVSDEPDNLPCWALDIERRSGHNMAAVALANKLARVAWRVWRDRRPSERRSLCVGFLPPLEPPEQWSPSNGHRGPVLASLEMSTPRTAEMFSSLTSVSVPSPRSRASSPRFLRPSISPNNRASWKDSNVWRETL